MLSPAAAGACINERNKQIIRRFFLAEAGVDAMFPPLLCGRHIVVFLYVELLMSRI